ncbi:nucleotidyltransferase family protein [Roseofilum sp. BLCC_M154]|uniref:Nucleotidyltransferase family protein n=1 Tax=Roseofilum acuticapitatum BLCC-M154 TaxID=3022444 RepID=A0ABT7AN25_9CYAN|nr:nucleotidyltransferase family protein [Roseofilum acuticapitatum]MDJ1168295.1 nucleotidyltransferase family protein [Roseofilum acuticapitatum BLCC-M154]
MKIDSVDPQIMNQEIIISTLQNHLNTLDNLGVKSLALFGSAARKQAKADSDLDFLVEFQGPATFDAYMDLKFFLEDLFNKSVDLVTRRSLKSQISQSVLAEAVYVTQSSSISR